MRKNEMFCPECGTKFASDDMVCSCCGRKRKIKRKIPVFQILSAVLTIALCVSVMYGFKSQKEMDEERRAANIEIVSLKGELREKSEKLMYSNDEISALKRKLDEDYTFLANQICVMQNDGTNTYHRWGCPYINLEKYGRYMIVDLDTAWKLSDDTTGYCYACNFGRMPAV